MRGRLALAFALLARCVVRGAPNLSAASITSCPADTGVAGLSLTGFPAPLTVAQIVAGDTTARSIYASILANSTLADALAIPPVTLGSNGLPVASPSTRC